MRNSDEGGQSGANPLRLAIDDAALMGQIVGPLRRWATGAASPRFSPCWRRAHRCVGVT